MFDADFELESHEDAEDHKKIVLSLMKDIRDLGIILKAIERIKKRHTQ